MCPKENNFPVVSDIPELMRLWSKEDNPLGLASQTYVNSKKVKATWICTECNRPYIRSVREVYSGKTVCKTCTSRKNAHDYIKKQLASEGSFADNYPERSLDWDYGKNGDLMPSQFLAGSNKIVYWKCHTCGYMWSGMIVNHVLTKYSCERCAIQSSTNQRYGKEPITKTNPELLQEWDYERNEKDGIFPEKITNHDTKTQVHWACKRGHHWSKSVSYRLHTTFDCPHCKKELQTSFPEQAIFFYLSKVTETINGYKIPNNSHIDVFMPLIKVGVEYDGEHFHSSEDSKRIEKWKDNYAIENGIKLYRVIESTFYGRENNKIFVIDDKRYSQIQYAIQILCQDLGLPLPIVNIDNDCIQISEQCLTSEKENSIAYLFPHLLEEWDYEKNGNIDPECISYGSGIKIYWKCKHGHSWPAPPSSRTKGSGCPYCSNKKVLTGFNDLATLRPDLLKEWDYEENNKKGIYPDKITTGYRAKQVSWICKNNPEHKWKTAVVSRTSGTGCTICAEEQRKITKRQTYVNKNGSFAENHKELLKDWYYERNNEKVIFPDCIPSHYTELVWWKCHECEYIWQATPDNRASGHGCTKCYEKNKSNISKDAALRKNGSLAQNNPEIAEFWDNDNNNGLTADDVTSNCHDKANWKCPICSHQWTKRVYKMTLHPCCPECKYSLNEKRKINSPV